MMCSVYESEILFISCLLIDGTRPMAKNYVEQNSISKYYVICSAGSYCGSRAARVRYLIELLTLFG
uniref:Uncharacterized protein n=1 Tax=Onchocerca volvulus TaxID=6282 RepID=A0A8R1TT35_ONCVO